MSTPKSEPAKVKLFPSGRQVELQQRDLCEIAPGEFGAACPPQHAKGLAYVRWQRVGEGMYQPIIVLMPTLVHASDWNPKLFGCSWYSVVRLAYAGFVAYYRPSARTTSIDLESYLEHVQATKDDYHYWTPDRIGRLEAVRIKKADLGEDKEDDENQPDIPLIAAHFGDPPFEPAGEGDAKNRTGDPQNGVTPPSAPSATLGVGRKTRQAHPLTAAAV